MKLIPKSYGSIVILGILFLIAVFPRLYLLGETEIYPDEISWMVRGKEAVYALKQSNLEFFKYSWWNSTTENESIGWPISLISAISLIVFGKGQSSSSFNLLTDYVAGRLPVALLAAVFIPLYYFLCSYFVSRKTAWLAAILLAIDTTHVGLSRWILHDVFLTTCTFISVTAFAIGIKQRNIYWAIVAGIFLSLGFLTKPNGLLPIIPWMIVVLMSGNLKEGTRHFILGLTYFFLATIIFWPASWVNPISSIFEYLYRQTQLSSIGIRYYFFGESSYAPPNWFYLFQILVKLPTVISLILVASLTLIIFRFSDIKNFLKPENSHVISFAIFCLAFLASISLPNIKLGARYALPLWPWIYLLVSQVFLKYTSSFKERYQLLSIIILVSLSLFSTVKYFPENYLYYNLLVGGPANAQKVDTVGLCAGTKGAVNYITRCFPSVKSIAVLGCGSVVAPYYFKGKISTDYENEQVTIVENSFTQLLPEEPAVKYFKSKTPLFISDKNGAILSRVYSKGQNFESACD